jgi:L-asparagine transporter-like permease
VERKRNFATEIKRFKLRKMKVKRIYIILMILIAITLFWNQNTVKPSLWIKAIGIVVFFYGMMKLSAKTPSKNQDNEE